MTEEYNSNQEQPEESLPEEGHIPEQTPEPEGPTPEEREAELRREFEERENQWREMLGTAIQGGGYSSNQQPTPSAPTSQDPDEIEWDDPQAVKRAFKQQSEQFKAQIEQAKNEVSQGYSSNQMQMYAQFATIAKDKTYENLRSMGKSDLIKDVEKYIRDNGVTPQQLAQPGAYETIAAVVVGEQTLKQAEYSSRRAPNLASGGRTGPSSDENLPKYNPEDLDFVRDRLGDIPEERIDFFSGSGPVSIDQYRNKFRKAN